MDYSQGIIFKATYCGIPFSGATVLPIKNQTIGGLQDAAGAFHSNPLKNLTIEILEYYGCKSENQLVARKKLWLSNMRTNQSSSFLQGGGILFIKPPEFVISPMREVCG